MANPQKERGYTPVANEILEQLVKMPLNGTQLRIILVVWRFTYGFSRKQHNLSINFILRAMGLRDTQYRQVSRELKKLFNIGLLHEVSKAGNNTRIISFNKDYDIWTNKTSGLIRPEDRLDQREGTKKTREPLDKLDPQDKQGKTTIKAIYTDDFEKFYQEYPRPEDKRRTFNNWKTCLKQYKVDQLMTACKNYKTAKKGKDQQYLKSSGNFLGKDKTFEDYLEGSEQIGGSVHSGGQGNSASSNYNDIPIIRS